MSRAFCTICHDALFSDARIDALLCGHVYHFACINRIRWVFPRFSSIFLIYSKRSKVFFFNYLQHVVVIKNINISMHFHYFFVLFFRRNGRCPMCRGIIEQTFRLFVEFQPNEYLHQAFNRLEETRNQLNDTLAIMQAQFTTDILLPVMTVEIPIQATARMLRGQVIINVPLYWVHMQRDGIQLEILNNSVIIRISRSSRR